MFLSRQNVSALTSSYSRSSAHQTPCGWLHLAYFDQNTECWHISCHLHPQSSPSLTWDFFLSLKYFPSINLPGHEVSYPCTVKRLAPGCLPFDSSPWYRSFWNTLDSSMYHAVELLQYSDHSLHQFVVFVRWFVSKLLSHDIGVCAPPLLLILVWLPCAPRCSTLTFNLHGSWYLLSGEALAMWRLLDLFCPAIPWEHGCLK